VELQLIESGNKTGSSDLYDNLCERCNKELSKLFLGNTLTTEAQATGSEALGNVHKKEEDQILKADQKFVLNVAVIL
jgi:phage gp29-like protein